MCGDEFNDRVLGGLFAATPPLEGLRMLIRWAATIDQAGRKRIPIADVCRAFFDAPAKRDVCVEVPSEALVDEQTSADIVGKPEASLYGARDASAKWQEGANTGMREWASISGR